MIIKHLKRKLFVYNNRREFFSIFKNIMNNDKNIIVHPEFDNQIYTKVDKKILSKGSDEDGIFLDFIKLDKNSVPKIIENYYEALGVKENAKNNEIRKNYLFIAKKFHPDKNEQTLVNIPLIMS